LGDTLSRNIYLFEANSIPMKDYTTPNHIAMSIDRHDAVKKFCVFGLKLWQSANDVQLSKIVVP
jgi:hypothetical protein